MFLILDSTVKYHATPAQHERPVRVLFASNTPPKLHQYYEHVMKLFTEHGATEQVLVFARHALAALITVETGEAVSTSTATARETITTSIFLAALELHRFDEAFAALADIRTAESRLSCLKTLVSTMCDAGAERQLCRMPFHSMEGDFVASLVFKARNSNVADRPNYYHVLYAYFVGRGDYKNGKRGR